MRKHYDIAASRALLETADAAAAALVEKMEGTEDDHRFRAVQRRFAPAKIALRLTVLEALNEGDDPDMILGAFGTAAAVVLFNLAADAGMEIEQVVHDFAEYAESALDAMVNEDGDAQGGVLVRSAPVTMPAGHA